MRKVTLTLTEDNYKRLMKLQKEYCGSSDKMLSEAIRMFEHIRSRYKKGYDLLMRKDNIKEYMIVFDDGSMMTSITINE